MRLATLASLMATLEPRKSKDAAKSLGDLGDFTAVQLC
jgi:hypothetical protein